jgi:hypothetical protein
VNSLENNRRFRILNRFFMYKSGPGDPHIFSALVFDFCRRIFAHFMQAKQHLAQACILVALISFHLCSMKKNNDHKLNTMEKLKFAFLVFTAMLSLPLLSMMELNHHKQTLPENNAGIQEMVIKNSPDTDLDNTIKINAGDQKKYFNKRYCK